MRVAVRSAFMLVVFGRVGAFSERESTIVRY